MSEIKKEEKVPCLIKVTSLNNLCLNISDLKFDLFDVSNIDAVRYLKGIFTNRERFINRFIEPKVREVPRRMRKLSESGELDRFDHVNLEEWEASNVFADMLIEIYDMVEAYSYEEAFKLENEQFKALVFGTIDVPEMIKNLGHKRLCTEGVELEQKKWSESGELLGVTKQNNIYEVHEVNGEKIGINEPLYAVRCWCTSTDKEHWLWIEDEYKDNPLAAIASTFRFHENVIPKIKELKRQGDIMLVEMTEDVEPEGEIIPLTSEQYFSLLTAQS